MQESISLKNQLITITLPDKDIVHFTIGNTNTWSMEKSASLLNITVKKGNIAVPDVYEFRKGNYLLSKNIWYYTRNIGPQNYAFSYDTLLNELTYNSGILYKFPFIFNSFYPLGYELSNIIFRKLYKIGFLVLRGSAFVLNDKNYLFMSPSLNGKTTLIKTLSSREDFTYISEDIVFVKDQTMYGVPLDSHNYGRKSNYDWRHEIKNVATKVEGIDYIINYRVSDKDLVESSILNKYALVENMLYEHKTMASAMAYYENFDPSVLYDNADKYFHGVPIYNLYTNGYNTEKVISLLYGI